MPWRPQDNALIAALPSGARTALAEELVLREFGHGDVFYQPHAPVDRVHFPVTGVLSVLTVMEDGTAVETATVGREGAVGLNASLSPVRAHGRVIGQAPGAVFTADVDVLRALASESAAVRELVVRYAEMVLSQAQQSVACNTLHDVEERFCRWILTCDDRVHGARVSLTQEFLAMMLGVQRTTVSQVASALQAAGLIRYNRGKIDILDRPALELRACECYGVLRGRLRELLPASDKALTPADVDDALQLDGAPSA